MHQHAPTWSAGLAACNDVGQGYQLLAKGTQSLHSLQADTVIAFAALRRLVCIAGNGPTLFGASVDDLF